MFDEFYAKRLTAEMNEDALSAMPWRRQKKRSVGSEAGIESAAKRGDER
jgi:hypothetical protein